MIQVEAIGYLAGDAEIREYNGAKFARFSVAVTQRRNDGNNTTTWLSCTKPVSESGNLTNYLTKGTKVFVQGALGAGAYSNRNGEPTPSLTCRVSTIKVLNYEQQQHQQ